MTGYALAPFILAAVTGLILAAGILKGKMASWPLSLTHGLFGALGLGMLFLAIFQGEHSGQVVTALGILVIAALGGFFLAAIHAQKKLPPKAVVGVHALVAVSGFLTLLASVLGL